MVLMTRSSDGPVPARRHDCPTGLVDRLGSHDYFWALLVLDV
jgi:hypothetical protein